MPMPRPLSIPSSVLALAAAVVLGACSGGPSSVDACRQIESARCVRAATQNCIDLSFPLHAGNAESDNITACQLYYQDACLHGLETPVAPAAASVSLCVKAINVGTCEVVLTPQSSPACAWLIPPDAGVDAGHDAAPDVSTTTTTTVTTTVSMDAGLGADTFVSTCDTSCEATCVNDPGCITACGC